MRGSPYFLAAKEPLQALYTRLAREANKNWQKGGYRLNFWAK
jgi:hypothetical protein